MNKLIQRYFYFLLGLAINSFGIAFITKSALGTSPISSIPYVFSLYFIPVSFGVFTFVFNMLYILIQLLILRRNFPPVQFLQIAANIIFSAFIDAGMAALWWFSPNTIPLRLGSLIFGCVILAVGISIEVAPNVITVPGEGIVRVISQAFHINFGTVKVLFDVTLIVTASVFSLIFFRAINGLGIGTVISALAVGRIVSLVNRRLPLIKHIRSLAASKNTLEAGRIPSA